MFSPVCFHFSRWRFIGQLVTFGVQLKRAFGRHTICVPPGVRDRALLAILTVKPLRLLQADVVVVEKNLFDFERDRLSRSLLQCLCRRQERPRAEFLSYTAGQSVAIDLRMLEKKEAMTDDHRTLKRIAVFRPSLL